MTVFSVGNLYLDDARDAYFCKIDCPDHPHTKSALVLTYREANERSIEARDRLATVRRQRVLSRHETLHKAERARWRKSRRSALR
jgi:hypothetical protein